jgi:hypothetical protein
MDLASAFSNIAASISARFGGPYVPGRVIDQTGQVFDDGGSIADPGAAVVRNCMVQVDVATEAMRQAEGYAEGDARFLILASGLSGTINTDATVQVLMGPGFGTWMVASVSRDPMGVYWDCRGRLSARSVEFNLSGAISAASALLGYIAADARLAGYVAGAGRLTGDLSGSALIAGLVSAQSSLTAAIAAGAPLGGDISALSSLLGQLSAFIFLSDPDGQILIDPDGEQLMEPV